MQCLDLFQDSDLSETLERGPKHVFRSRDDHHEIVHGEVFRDSVFEFLGTDPVKTQAVVGDKVYPDTVEGNFQQLKKARLWLFQRLNDLQINQSIVLFELLCIDAVLVKIIDKLLKPLKVSNQLRRQSLNGQLQIAGHFACCKSG